jgi:hypothetical protein
MSPVFCCAETVYYVQRVRDAHRTTRTCGPPQASLKKDSNLALRQRICKLDFSLKSARVSVRSGTSLKPRSLDLR